VNVLPTKLCCTSYPLCRSITGDGLRESLRIIQEHIPLEIREVPSGTPVFDWTVPKEWNIKDAYIKGPDGEKIVDIACSNLHVLNYSVPVKCRLSLNELKEHLYSLPQHPDWIPYRTSYYNENWGFCLSQNQLAELQEGDYEVCIDSSLREGYLTYGECFLEGETEDEVLISTHVCHPSLANDNLSGIALAAFLAKHLRGEMLRYSYRLLFIPGTIGSITWLAKNEDRVARIKHGLVVVCVGDAGSMTYKKTRQGNAEIDQVVEHVLRHSGEEHRVVNFVPYGYDERQFCSPAFNLPVGSLSRSPHGRFPQYHTSADNLEFVQPEHLGDSFSKYLEVLHILESNKKYLNLNPKCEPQLGKRGLYRALGGNLDSKSAELAMLWVLNLSDGNHTLLNIAEKSGVSFQNIRDAADNLVRHQLLSELP